MLFLVATANETVIITLDEPADDCGKHRTRLEVVHEVVRHGSLTSICTVGVKSTGAKLRPTNVIVDAEAEVGAFDEPPALLITGAS
jgi:hypothetical protein